MRRRDQQDSSGSENTESTACRLDRTRGVAFIAGREVPLTAAECRLLDLLLREPGKTLTRKQLMEAVTGGEAVVQERTVDVHICALRQKLGAPGLIETVRTVGYRWRDDPEKSLEPGASKESYGHGSESARAGGVDRPGRQRT